MVVIHAGGEKSSKQKIFEKIKSLFSKKDNEEEMPVEVETETDANVDESETKKTK